MTDAPARMGWTGRTPARLSPWRRLSRATKWRVALTFAAVLAVAASFWMSAPATSAAAVTEAGPQLTLLLRFMAVLKGVAALALLALSVWRLGSPVQTPFAVAYIAAAGLMACAPVLIWQMVHVGDGAILFHTGWLALLVTALLDREGRAGMSAHMPARLAGLMCRRR